MIGKIESCGYPKNDTLKKCLTNSTMVSQPVYSRLAGHFNLSSKQCPRENDRIKNWKIHYAYAIDSLTYDMVCTEPRIAHAFGVVNRFLLNPKKEHRIAGEVNF